MSSNNANFTAQRRGKAAQTNKTQPPAAETMTPMAKEITDVPTVSETQTEVVEPTMAEEIAAQGRSTELTVQPQTVPASGAWQRQNGNERKSCRVSYMLKPSVYNGLLELARREERSPNEMVNRILTAALQERGIIS